MSNLFGTNPNQVPLNSMLGNLAFQDKAYVSVDKVGIGTTFVDSGTSGQILQVYGGGAYVSGSVGIGTTNPSDPLDVSGVVRPRLGIRDSYGNVGAAGSILISTGAGVSWTPTFAAGLQGLQGLQGSQGTQGIQGIQGSQGRQGIQGLQGSQGTQGTQGLQGSQGIQGTQGTQGLQGSQGTQGTQGLQGSQGTQGTQGLQGSQGSQGTQGTQGTQGLQGSQGTQGTQGLQGSQGTQGTQGLQGSQGTQGTQGLQGSQGIQGTQGTQGLQGSQGTQGTQGLQGTQGTQGLQGTQGTQGTQGLQGSQGIQGTQGTQGLQGSQGTQGTQGLQGTQGRQGIQGLQGSQGTQGTQGLQGTQGTQGTQGLQGSQGTQGTQGLQGPQATQGLQGSQGTQGTQGIQGLQGPQATQGIQGSNNGGVTVVNDTTTNATRYIAFEDVTSGVSTTIGVSNTKLLFNPSTGNVGINSTSPIERLDVVGNVQVRGYLLLPQNPNSVGFGTTIGNPSYAIKQTVGDNDAWMIYGESPSGTNTASMILEVNDDVTSTEKIIFRNRRNYSGAPLGVVTYMEMNSSSNIMEFVPLLIGTSSLSGTSSQLLQVNSGAYVSGSFGVGTTLPTNKLMVQGDARFVTSAQGDVTITHSNLVSSIRGASSVQLGLGANGSDIIRINNSGNVGINSLIPSFTLDVIGASKIGTAFTSIQIGGDNGRNIEIGVGATDIATYLDFRGAPTYTDHTSRLIRNPGDDGDFNIINRGNGSFNLICQDSGVINFSTKNTFRHRINSDGIFLVGTATSTGTTSQLLQVNSGAYFNGVVGIGRTNPGVISLDVNGIARIGGSTSGKVIIGSGMAAGEYGLSILPYSNRTELQAEEQGTSYRPLILQPFGSNVGIGSTIPSTALDIRGQITVTNSNTNGLLIRSGSSSSWAAMDVGRTGSEGIFAVAGGPGIFANNAVAGDIIIRANSGSGKILFNRLATDASLAIDGTNILVGTISSTGTTSQPLQVSGGAYVSGNFGVGATNPGAKLEISASGDGTKVLKLNTERAWSFLQTGSGSTTALELNSEVDDKEFRITSNDRSSVLRVFASNSNTSSFVYMCPDGGSVGVGTANPQYELDVVGDLRVTGIITASGGINAPLYVDESEDDNNFYNIPFLDIAGVGGDAYRLMQVDDGGLRFNPGANVFSVQNIQTPSSILSLGSATGKYGIAIVDNGDVGIGTTNPQYKLHVLGSFGATTKSFIIDHPTKEGMKLQYGSLEGPELGVYIRGRSKESIIKLPDYWSELVDEETITVNLTAIGESGDPRIRSVGSDQIEVFSKNGHLDYYFTVFAERKDVEKLEVEF